MTTEPRDTDPFYWLFRVLALVVVLPARIAGQVVVRIGDTLLRWVGRPVSWAFAAVSSWAARYR